MKPTPSSRTAALQISAASAAALRANQLRQHGAPMVDLSRGELDFTPPDCVHGATTRALQDPRAHHYGPAAGLSELRQEVAQNWTTEDNPLHPNQVLITNGTKHALWQACLTIINPGDDILLPTPYWASYPSMIELAGGHPVLVPTTADSQYKIVPELLDAHRTPTTKALVFVSPANPTGSVYTDEEARAIGRWALDCGIVVISDEIYSALVYPPYSCTSIVDLVPALADQSLRAGGIGKSHAMTGWRVGWIAGPDHLIKKAIALQSHTSGHPCNLAQLAAVAALTEGDAWLTEARANLNTRRQLLTDGLSAIAQLTYVEPRGAFYVLADITGVLGFEIAGTHIESSGVLAQVLLEHAHVATVAGEAFGAPRHLRLSFAASCADIEEGLTRLADILTSAEMPHRGGRHAP